MSVFRSRSLRVVVLVSLLTLLLPIQAAHAGVTTFTFSVYLNNTYLQGSSSFASTLHTVSLLDSSGNPIDRVYVTSDGSGYWSANFDTPVVPTDKVKVSAGGEQRTVTVPRLSIRANRVTDVFFGKAPANALLSLSFAHYPTLDPSSYTYHNALVTASGGGDWSLDVTVLANMSGSDNASVFYENASGDQFQASATVPYMSVRRGSPALAGDLNVGTTATFELRKSNNDLRATASASWYSAYGGIQTFFSDSSGNFVPVRATNKVIGSFATDALITIPAIAFTADVSSDQATGACLPNAPFSLYIRRSDYSASQSRYGTTNGTGALALNLSTWNVQTTDRSLLTCRYAAGDTVAANGLTVP